MVTCIEDLRVHAKRRVPRMFYDYVDSGSWTESTYRENTSDFQRLKLSQRVCTDIQNRNLHSTMLKESVSMPVALAPTGMAGMQRADGEILAAKAAEKFGVPFTLSTMSICSIEDVAAHTTKPFWFQLYVMKDREFVERLLTRAKLAGCSALVVTLDLPVQGQRHKDIKNGLSAPPKMTFSTLINLLSKPRWCLEALGTPRRTFGNIVGHVAGVTDISSMADWVSEQFDQTLCWSDLDWIRRYWGGPLIVKGIMDVNDAKRAVQSGADALIVSNHGGRQLDGALSSIRALPRIVDAVGHQIEVHFDGGIRSGQDILKAMALGAKATYIGRPYLYGLGARGETGVTECLQILRKELDLSMALCGRNDINSIDKTVLDSESWN